MKKLLMVIAFLLLPVLANAQITPPYTFTAGTPILSSQVNANFAVFADALNRKGGTITGNITVASGVTIDGVDISDLSNPATFLAVNGGTATDVPFGFADDPGTGMWSSANDRIDWALNEVTYMYLTTAGLNLTGGLTTSGNFTVGANKFTVNASSGNTVILGDLSVGGTLTGAATSFTGSLSGDVTSTGMATTLATVNANVGTFGDSTNIPTITVNAKGLVTAISQTAISAGSTIPSDMVAFFAATCPTGWSEYTAARGRYVVAMPSGGTLAGTLGQAFTDLEARAVGSHAHGNTLGVTLTEPNSGTGHRHGGVAQSGGDTQDGVNSADYVTGYSGDTSYATTGLTATVTGGVSSFGTSTTPAPYIQLLACIKS